VFFVNSVTGNNTTVGSGSNGVDPTTPFKTLAFAITQCVSSNADVIYLMPGHVETVSSATSHNINKIGVTIIGLGNKTNRPKLNFSATTSVLTISAASVAIKNVQLYSTIDEVVTAISVTAAYATLDAVDVVETSAKQFIQFCLTVAAATDLTIQNCIHHQSTASASNALWIQLVGADRFKILNNLIQITTTNSASSSVIESDTTAPVNGLLLNNIIVQLGGTATIPIKMVASTSGFALNNFVASQKTAIAGSIALASMYGANNYAGHVANTNGLLEPVVDS
jgi:hypothetical protein